MECKRKYRVKQKSELCCAGSVEPVRHYSEYYKRCSESGTKEQPSWYHYMRLRNENGQSLQA